MLRRSRGVSTPSLSSARSCVRPSSRIGLRVSRNRRRLRRATASGIELRPQPLGDRLGLVAAVDVASEVGVLLERVERGPGGVEPRVGVDPDRQVEGVGVGGLRLVEPAARQVERVAGAEDDVVGRLAVVAKRLRVALVLERELHERVVEEPALLAGDLEDEDVVGVVVHREALRAAGRVVRVGLHRQAERLLELPAEDRQREPVDVQRLEDDRGAGLPLRDDAPDVRGLRERRAPRHVLRVGAQVELSALADESERRVADRRRADEPLDVSLREEVVEAARLAAGDDERLPLPVLREERLGADGIEAALERRLGRAPAQNPAQAEALCRRAAPAGTMRRPRLRP